MADWLESFSTTVESYRKMVDAIVSQLSDEELTRRPAPDVNSVAIILRHLGGNLASRWKDFLTTDGEKPDRDRDLEFEDWPGDRESLMEYFNHGWTTLTAAIQQLDNTAIQQTIRIRGESHPLTDALMRSLTHVSYHIGQIAVIARLVHEGDWHWLTIAPGQSKLHNENTWGTSASRSIFATEPASEHQPDSTRENAE